MKRRILIVGVVGHIHDIAKAVANYEEAVILIQSEPVVYVRNPKPIELPTMALSPRPTRIEMRKQEEKRGGAIPNKYMPKHRQKF